MLYGRFAKPVARFARDGISFANPTFRRLGYGSKIGWEQNGQEAHVIFFRGYDDVKSIPITDSLEVTPEENLVVGLVTNLKFFNKFTWTLDWAYSLHTSNTLSEEVFIDEFTFVNNLGNLFTPRASSAYANAYNTTLTYAGEKFQLNLTYRRVDPSFRTLGSSFLNNDLEDISGGISFPLLKSKLQMSANIGMQRNNLDQQLSAQVRRLIYSIGSSVNLSEKTNLNLNYSNFNSSTRQSVIQEDLLSDTLEFFQVSRNGTFNIVQSFGSDEQTKQLNVYAAIQDATDSDGNASTFLTSNLSFQMRLYKVWNLTVSGTINNNKAGEINNLTTGPIVNISRNFKKGQYRISLATSVLNVYTDGALQSNINNIKFSGSIRVGKKHNFSVGSFYVIRNTPGREEGSRVRELRANVNYNFRI